MAVEIEDTVAADVLVRDFGGGGERLRGRIGKSRLGQFLVCGVCEFARWLGAEPRFEAGPLDMRPRIKDLLGRLMLSAVSGWLCAQDSAASGAMLAHVPARSGATSFLSSTSGNPATQAAAAAGSAVTQAVAVRKAARVRVSPSGSEAAQAALACGSNWAHLLASVSASDSASSAVSLRFTTHAAHSAGFCAAHSCVSPSSVTSRIRPSGRPVAHVAAAAGSKFTQVASVCRSAASEMTPGGRVIAHAAASAGDTPGPAFRDARERSGQARPCERRARPGGCCLRIGAAQPPHAAATVSSCKSPVGCCRANASAPCGSRVAHLRTNAFKN